MSVVKSFPGGRDSIVLGDSDARYFSSRIPRSGESLTNKVQGVSRLFHAWESGRRSELSPA